MHWSIIQEMIDEEEYKFMSSLSKLESVHPIDLIENYEDVLNEAGVTVENMDQAIPNIYRTFVNVIKKFRDITIKLKRENNVWINEAKKFNVDDAKLENFTYEIYPYWRGEKLYTSQIVDFNEQEMSLYENSAEFMRRYYHEIMSDDDNGKVDKNKFRGLSKTNTKKVEIKESDAAAKFRTMINSLNRIYNLRDNVSMAFDKVARTLKSYVGVKITVNESTLLDMSIFKDEYFDILIESILNEAEDGTNANQAAQTNNTTVTTASNVTSNKDSGGVTTEELEQEAKDKEDKKKGINTNKKENNENKSKLNKTKAVIAWAKLMSNIFTAEMDILDEMYDEYIKYIKLIMSK